MSVSERKQWNIWCEHKTKGASPKVPYHGAALGARRAADRMAKSGLPDKWKGMVKEDEGLEPGLSTPTWDGL